MAAENLREKHSRKDDVIGKLGLSGALRPRINLAERLADYVEWFPVLFHLELRISTRINADLRGFKQNKK